MTDGPDAPEASGPALGWARDAATDIEDSNDDRHDEDPSTWAFAEHEHIDLVRGIQRIHDIACQVGCVPTDRTVRRPVDVWHWIDGTLEPHIAWEEAWLYPEIDARTDSPWATRAARFDHRQIRGIAAELRADQVALRTNRPSATTPRSAVTCSARGPRSRPHRARGALPHPAPCRGDGPPSVTSLPGGRATDAMTPSPRPARRAASTPSAP